MATASSNEFQLVFPETAQGTIVYIGFEFTVPCHLSPEISAVDMEIRWFKETDCVCIYKNRQMIEGRGYEGRVNLFTEKLEKGDVSLSLKHWESDLGDYVCQVTCGVKTEEITVRVKCEKEELSIQRRIFLMAGLEFFIKQVEINRRWTEEEKLKMEESVLIAEYKNPEDLKRLLTERNKLIQEKENIILESKQTLQMKDMALKEKDRNLKDMNDKLLQTIKELEKTQSQLKEKETQIDNMNKLMSEKERLLENTVKELETSKHQLETLRNELQEMKTQQDEQKTIFTHQEKTLQEHKQQQKQSDQEIKNLHSELELLKSESSTHLSEASVSTAPVRRRHSKELDPPSMSTAPVRSFELDLPNMSGETASVFTSGSELRLVLVGSAGSEKSASVNIILNREEKIQTDTSTEIQQSESRQGEVNGKQVTVVETPDWFCSDLSLEEVREDVRLCVRLSAPGPHAFLLIIPVQQSTGVERAMLEKMEEIFGERCWRNTMILFTVTDEEQEKNFEDFVQSGNQEVQRLVEKCGNRFHCLNIHQSGDDSQISELLEKIEKMMEGNTDFYRIKAT